MNQNPSSPFQISFCPLNYVATLFALTVVLLGCHLGLYLYHYRVEELPWLLLQLFDLDEENNIPTWFSSFLLLNNAIVLFLHAEQVTTERKRAWSALALGFFVLSIDEVAGLHESFNSAVDFNWAIPGGILAALVGCAFVPFLLSLRRGLALWFILSGILYLSGAILTELLSEDLEVESVTYVWAVFVEEGLEMFGALLFLFINLREMTPGGVLAVEPRLVSPPEA